jgi:hypothetical protein
MKFNSSYQYSFNDDRGRRDCSCSGPDSSYKSAVGAQLFIMTAPRAPIMALTGYVRQHFKGLDLKATYSRLIFL